MSKKNPKNMASRTPATISPGLADDFTVSRSKGSELDGLTFTDVKMSESQEGHGSAVGTSIFGAELGRLTSLSSSVSLCPHLRQQFRFSPVMNNTEFLQDGHDTL
jgi:hypothetical protein